MDFKLIAQDIRYAKPTIWRTNKETLEATAKNQKFCVFFLFLTRKCGFRCNGKSDHQFIRHKPNFEPLHAIPISKIIVSQKPKKKYCPEK